MAFVITPESSAGALPLFSCGNRRAVRRRVLHRKAALSARNATDCETDFAKGFRADVIRRAQGDIAREIRIDEAKESVGYSISRTIAQWTQITQLKFNRLFRVIGGN